MSAREEPYATFVAAYRDQFIGTAALVHLLDPARTESLVDGVLVHTYATWPRLDDPYGWTLRAVLHGSGGATGAPARTFDLVDVAHPTARPDENIRSELAALTADERQILVLATYTRLPVADIARVLHRDVDDVRAQLAAAHRHLLTMPRRHTPRRLATELAAAAPPPRTDPRTDTRQEGRSVVRQRWLRLAALATIVLVLAAFGVRQLLPTGDPVASDPPVDLPTTSPPPCDTSEQSCRSAIVTSWRAEMAGILSEYLDPNGRYFTAVSYSVTDQTFDPNYWMGDGGAFVVKLSRPGDGATEVSLEVATSRADATPCGRTTKRPCQSQKFMDGNRFLLNDPYDVAHGLEVQYRPAGTYVISLVARNTSKGARELDVARGDLMRLILDPRLQLPAR